MGSYAIVSEPINRAEANTDAADWLLSDEFLGDVRLRASDGDLFLGVGPTSDVRQYLQGVEHHRLTDVYSDTFRTEYDVQPGDAPSGPPAEQDSWVASASGTGEQTLNWNPESGNWSAVVMARPELAPSSASAPRRTS